LLESETKKVGADCSFFVYAYRFLSISTITATPAMIAMIMRALTKIILQKDAALTSKIVLQMKNFTVFAKVTMTTEP
jgi:hypothetical protein